MHILYDSDNHKNFFYSQLSVGIMVQANQHIIVHNGEALILDPGGHKVHTSLLSSLSEVVPIHNIKIIFFSHQDPDIIAAANAWLMLTDARAYLSGLWMRFIPHFGVDELVMNRIQPIPDQGMVIELGGLKLPIIPAHFLHSPGNFHLYDPASRILYTGDLGASFGYDDIEVRDFEAHIPRMITFHKRYMASSRVLKAWARTVKKLDIDVLAPQHGAIFTSKDMVHRFIDWVESLEVGVDVLGDEYPVIEGW